MIFDHLIVGTNGSDLLDDAAFATGEAVLIRGLGGHDIINSTGTANCINGGAGNDIIHANGGTIHGGDGNDHIYGSDAFERVDAGFGVNYVNIGANGLILAGDGSGIFVGSTDSSSLNETVSYAWAMQDYTVVFNSGSPDEVLWGGNTDQLTGIDRIVTSDGNDTVLGSGKAYAEVDTRGGDDLIDFSADTAVIHAGRGNDTVVLRQHVNLTADIDVGTGVDRVFCGDGAETIHFNPAGAARIERATTYVMDFAQGIDKIGLHPGMSISAFLLLGHNANISGVDGVRFDTAHGDMLFLAGLTMAQITPVDFIA